jgi:stage V sporulation protein R
MAKKSKLLYEDNNWTFDRIKRADEAIAEIAFKELKLDIYPNQIEIIGSDQMLDAYSSVGLPIMYNHWSFGKNFIQEEYSYRKGLSGLAYEIVINSNPCISYCMEENSMTMQTLVIAHAAYGHNHFFKNNYLFKQWTDAESIVDYLLFARNYINKCEEEHGPETVESILDACHAIMDYGVDRYKRPAKLNKQKEKERQKERAEYVQAQANLLWSTLPKKFEVIKPSENKVFPAEPQENLLYFIEKHSPKLEAWQREIVRIIRKISQYFYPQRQTKLMNEGWASFVHYYIMKRLWEKGLIDDGAHLEFLHSHSSVLYQRLHDSKHYSGFNPYALGFAMFTDIRRICENPTAEDKEYFPHMAGEPWLDVCLDAVANYRDESFVTQFLSPALIREWQLFEVTNEQKEKHYLISGIQNKTYYNDIRNTLSKQYSIQSWQPDIQIINANLDTTRTLQLRYNAINEAQLTNTKYDVMEHIEKLWGYHVVMEDNLPPPKDLFMGHDNVC